MNLSAWSIRNPIAPILVFFVLVVLGWQSFNALPITQFPNIDIPIVSIVVTQSGATPVELETQVTKLIEDEVAGISGVDHIESTVTDGRSATSVTFHWKCPPPRPCRMPRDAVDRIPAAIFRPRSIPRSYRESSSKLRRSRPLRSPHPA